MLPSGAKYGLLIDLETCFNIKIDTNLDFNNSSGMRDSRRLVGSIGDLENDQSLANSEAAVRDVSPGDSGKKTAQSIKARKAK